MQEWKIKFAKHYAEKATGETPRWCDERDESGRFPSASFPEAMDESIALDSSGQPVVIDRWLNGEPCSQIAAFVCYF